MPVYISKPACICYFFLVDLSGFIGFVSFYRFVFLKLLQNNLNSFFQLGIFAFGQLGRVFRNFHIRVYTMAFFKPCAIRVVHAESWNCNHAAINKARSAGNANEAAPGSCTNKLTQSRFSEIIGECITTGATPTVNKHYLGTKISYTWPLPVFLATNSPIGQWF